MRHLFIAILYSITLPHLCSAVDEGINYSYPYTLDESQELVANTRLLKAKYSSSSS